MLNVIVLNVISTCGIMLSVAMLNVIMLNVIVLNFILTSGIMLSVGLLNVIFDKWHLAECRHAECR